MINYLFTCLEIDECNYNCDYVLVLVVEKMLKYLKLCAILYEHPCFHFSAQIKLSTISIFKNICMLIISKIYNKKINK